MLLRLVAIVLAPLLWGGCRREEPTPPRARPASTNVLSSNGVVLENGYFQELGARALSTEGLADLDPDVIDPGLFEYLVECALPADQSVLLGGTMFHGKTGLAPEWAEAPCELACQEWVSACLLTRTNTYSIPVLLYTTSMHPVMEDDRGDADFPSEEGAFWGNLFVRPPLEYACRGTGADPLILSFRVCAQPGNRCGIQWVGPCGRTDGDTGLATERHACEDLDPERGAYRRCHNRASNPGSNAFPAGTFVSDRVLTTHLAATEFGAGDEDPCTSDLVEPPVPAEVPGGAGAPCHNDDDCATDLGMLCDARPPGGMCTTACTSSGDTTAEEKQCGGDRTTCLVSPPDQELCTASCTPGFRGGDCAPGQACQSFWPLFDTPDDPGCYPYCTNDDECPPTKSCDRFGNCGPGVDLDALADGEPCTFPPGSNEPEVPCRGACLRPDSLVPEQGLCASFIHLAETDRCPDVRDAMRPLTGDDDIGLCVYRSCDTDDDCTPPLACIPTAEGGRCQWP